MPFDGENFKIVDLRVPSLPALSYALRNPHLWPSDFTYAWSDPCRCGLGLARRLWPGISHEENAAFGIDTEQRIDLFLQSVGRDALVEYRADVPLDAKPKASRPRH